MCFDYSIAVQYNEQYRLLLNMSYWYKFWVTHLPYNYFKTAPLHKLGCLDLPQCLQLCFSWPAFSSAWKSFWYPRSILCFQYCYHKTGCSSPVLVVRAMQVGSSYSCFVSLTSLANLHNHAARHTMLSYYVCIWEGVNSCVMLNKVICYNLCTNY